MNKHEKGRFIAFILAGTAASLFGIAYAASFAVKETGEISGVTIAVIFSGLAQIGCAGFMIKKYTDKVDKDNATLPVVVTTLEAQRQQIATHAENLVELYRDRNRLDKGLEAVTLLHEILKCKDKALIPRTPRSGLDRRDHPDEEDGTP
jgi:hypothetical protein